MLIPILFNLFLLSCTTQASHADNLALCKSAEINTNSTQHGKVTLKSKYYAVSMTKTKHGIHIERKCKRVQGKLERHIQQNVGNRCDSQEIVNLVRDLSPLPHKTTTVSAPILCNILAGTNAKCPTHTKLALGILAFDLVMHEYHEDCLPASKHLFENEREFSIHTKIISNWSTFDLSFGVMLLILQFQINFLYEPRKSSKSKFTILNKISYITAFTWNFTILSFLIILGKLTCKNLTIYTFTKLCEPNTFQNNNSEQDNTFNQKSKSPQLLLNSECSIEEYAVLLHQEKLNKKINANQIHKFEHLNTAERSAILIDNLKQTKQHIRNYRIASVIFQITLNLIFASFTWVFTHLVIARINFFKP